MPQTYCEAVRTGQFNEKHRQYHDTEYGFPEENDNALFGRLLMEINQAGLSWNTVLNKRESMQAAYANFEVATVAQFSEIDILRLLKNPGIIRMRKKIEAAIYNANQILSIQEKYGSFYNWLNLQHPQKEADWIKLFKRQFKFTGKEITKEFLMGTGYLKGAHESSCPIYSTVMAAQPKWRMD